MGFITGGMFGGALVGGFMGAKNNQNQGFMGTLGSIGTGMAKGAMMGGALGVGARVGMRQWNRLGGASGIGGRMKGLLGRSNKPAQTSNQALAAATGGYQGAKGIPMNKSGVLGTSGIPGRLDLATTERMAELNYSRTPKVGRAANGRFVSLKR
jgi:hypothetical protein